MGLPPHPRRTRPARHHHRRVDRVGDPQNRRYRPCAKPSIGVVDDVPPRASGRDRRVRLLHRRHRHVAPLLRAVLHRTRHAPRPPRRHHHQPDRRLDHPSRPQLHDALRPDDPVPDPRRRRPVRRRVRRGLPQRRRDDHPHATAYTPVANAYAERWVGTVRRELLDRTLVWNRRHLEQLLRDYVEHYNTHRPHRSLGQRAPDDRGVVEYRPGRPIRRHRTCGGLINEYRQAA